MVLKYLSVLFTILITNVLYAQTNKTQNIQPQMSAACDSVLSNNSALIGISYISDDATDYIGSASLNKKVVTNVDIADLPEAVDSLESEYRNTLEDVVTTPHAITLTNTIEPIASIQKKLVKLKELIQLKLNDISKYKVTEKKDDEKKLRTLIQKLEFTAENLVTETYLNSYFRERVNKLVKNAQNLNSLERVILDDWTREFANFDNELKNNPLLVKSDLDYGAFRYDKIKIEHFYPALLESLHRAKENFAELVNNPKSPTYKNTVYPLTYIDQDLERVGTLLYLYHSNNGSAEIRAELTNLVKMISAKSLEFSSSIFTNEVYYNRVKAVAKAGGLNPARQKQVDNLLKSFEESGIGLAPAERAHFLTLKKELSDIQTDYVNNTTEQNTLKNFHVIVTDPAELTGIEPSVVDRAKKNAEELKIQGWAFDSEIDTLFAIYEYAESDDLRKKYWMARNAKNNNGDEFDNTENVKKIVKNLHEIAQLLGYKHHAQRTLSINRMAKTPERVMKFLDDLLEKVKPKADQDLKELMNYKFKVTGDNSPLKPWQVSYWIARYKEEKYNFDDRKLKPYFEANRVQEGAFKVANKLYGLEFTERPDLPVYNPTVKVFEVTRREQKIGLMYVDLYSRRGEKRGGAWMNVLSPQDRTKKGERIPPIVSINANFIKATEGQTYLSFDEVTTLFHEFGHALHGLFSDVELQSQASPKVSWDFVELPSQFMENYVYERQVLDMFAYNENEELLPSELLNAKIESDTFGSANMFLSQLRSGYLDMAYYSEAGASGIDDLTQFESEAVAKLKLLEPTGLERPYATVFSHIMAGGYSAGYYSYKWAEVLDADAFAAFKNSGDIFNSELAVRFENLLSSGGSIDADQLYYEFRGKEPSVDHLLRRSKIIP
ncbi:MAG: M3 family metallopeptidase [Bdellovibrionaceae bacterium]|nr:M3 family metallopeptidase [Pseudobdellovibrionaceae bacterium]